MNFHSVLLFSVLERGEKSQRHRNEMCSSSLILNARKTGLNFCYLVYFNCSLSGTKVIVGKVGGCFCLSSGPLCVQMKNCSIAADMNSVSWSPFPLGTSVSLSNLIPSFVKLEVLFVIAALHSQWYGI